MSVRVWVVTVIANNDIVSVHESIEGATAFVEQLRERAKSNDLEIPRTTLRGYEVRP